MKVLWLVRPAEGGILVHLNHLLAGLRKDYQIVLVGPNELAEWWGDNPFVPLEISDGLKFTKDLSAIWSLSRIIRSQQPRLIHLHGLKSVLLGVPAARLAGCYRVLFTAHNSLPQYGSVFKRHSHGFVQQRLLAAIPAIISVSEAVRNELSGLVPEHRIRTVRNGVDVRCFSGHNRAEARSQVGAVAGQLVVGTVSRLIHNKGIATLLEATSLVKNVIPNLRVVIVGEGPARARFESYRDRLGLTDQVCFLGYRKDVPQLMAGWDAFVLPSYSEGFNISLLEAMASRLPIISSDLPSVREAVVPTKSGLLVQPKDAPGLAAAILHLLKDLPRARAMGEYNKKRVQSVFGVDQMVQSTKAIYDDLGLREHW